MSNLGSWVINIARFARNVVNETFQEIFKDCAYLEDKSPAARTKLLFFLIMMLAFGLT